jgi:hypothetical protein
LTADADRAQHRASRLGQAEVLPAGGACRGR